MKNHPKNQNEKKKEKKIDNSGVVENMFQGLGV